MEAALLVTHRRDTNRVHESDFLAAVLAIAPEINSLTPSLDDSPVAAAGVAWPL
jgi:hypothetical protein